MNVDIPRPPKRDRVEAIKHLLAMLTYAEVFLLNETTTWPLLAEACRQRMVELKKEKENGR